MSTAIVIASDHGGVELKAELTAKLRKAGFEVTDLGAHSSDACDYPDFAHEAAAGVVAGRFEKAILVCGTGVGMAIAANRHQGIRAVNCTDTFSARSSREHNDANVLCLGGRVLGPGLAWDIVKLWLETPFSGDDRHRRRIAKLDGR